MFLWTCLWRWYLPLILNLSLRMGSQVKWTLVRMFCLLWIYFLPDPDSGVFNIQFISLILFIQIHKKAAVSTDHVVLRISRENSPVDPLNKWTIFKRTNVEKAKHSGDDEYRRQVIKYRSHFMRSWKAVRLAVRLSCIQTTFSISISIFPYYERVNR